MNNEINKIEKAADNSQKLVWEDPVAEPLSINRLTESGSFLTVFEGGTAYTDVS